jgi:hypothetical protein
MPTPLPTDLIACVIAMFQQLSEFRAVGKNRKPLKHVPASEDCVQRPFQGYPRSRPERVDVDLLGRARHCITASPKCFDANEAERKSNRQILMPRS